MGGKTLGAGPLRIPFLRLPYTEFRSNLMFVRLSVDLFIRLSAGMSVSINSFASIDSVSLFLDIFCKFPNTRVEINF